MADVGHIIGELRKNLAGVYRALEEERALKRELHVRIAQAEKECRDLRLELDRRNRELAELKSRG